MVVVDTQAVDMEVVGVTWAAVGMAAAAFRAGVVDSAAVAVAFEEVADFKVAEELRFGAEG